MVPFTALNVAHPLPDHSPALASAPVRTPSSPRAIAPAASGQLSPAVSPSSRFGDSADKRHHNDRQMLLHQDGVVTNPSSSSPEGPVSQLLPALRQQQHQQRPSYDHGQTSAVAAAASSPVFIQPLSPPLRKDTASSVSTQASIESNNTSYSAESPPSLHQAPSMREETFQVAVSNLGRINRRRTGPLSQASRERAALIRKLGACRDCRRRRVACHPGHHNMTWEQLQEKYRRSMSPPANQEMPRPFATGHPHDHANGLQPLLQREPHDMDIDSGPTENHLDKQGPHHQHMPRQAFSDTSVRTPLPGGRLEKSLSLPGIESLKNDLQTNISQMLSSSSRTRYQSVEVVLALWEEDDDFQAVNSAVRELADVLGQYYHYTFEILLIPSPSESCKSPGRWLYRKLHDFVENSDQRDVLKIVFYAGHSFLDEHRDMTLSSSRDMEKASTIRWNHIQQVLEDACSDVLILMDAAYYPSAKMVRSKGMLEIIAASISEDQFRATGRCAFTRALADQLRTRGVRFTPLSAAELHASLVSAYSNLAHDRTMEKAGGLGFPAPLHIMMSSNPRLPSIFLAPTYSRSPLRSSSLGYENNPQLHLSIKLNDDNVDVDSWNEWLRLMPEGIKDIRVEGPFRAAYR